MSNKSDQLKIRGQVVLTIEIGLIGAIVISTFGFAFMFMGTGCAHMFVNLSIFMTLLILLALVIQRPSNWFAFDDKNQKIVKSFRNQIPYSKIQEIIITETPRRFNVRVKAGWLPAYPIVSGLTKEDAEHAEKEFKLRFPLNTIRRESYSKNRFKIAIGLPCFIGVFVLGTLLLQYIVQGKHPYEVVSAEEKEWFTSHYPQEGTRHKINGISFQLSESFVQVKKDRQWTQFEEKGSQTKVNVGLDRSNDSNIQDKFIMGFISGLRTDLDWYRLAYTARYGLIPTFMNSHVFGELFEIKLYELKRGSMQGIVLRGMKGSKSVAEILIANNNSGIHFFISQPGEMGKIKEEFLRSIVGSIRSEL